MKSIKMQKKITEGVKKTRFSFFILFFMNNDISITVSDIVLKVCMPVLYSHPEGRLSQFFYI